MKELYRTPTLEAKTKSGETKFWVGVASENVGKYYRQSITWQSTKDGGLSVKTYSDLYEVEATNVGRANERSAEDQAIFEVKSLMTKKKDKGYAEHGEEPEVFPQPMLAHKFKDRAHKVEYPCYVQPKFNGQRMLYDGTKAWTRGNKLVLPEVIAHLQFNTRGAIIDGELMLPSMPVLQESMRAIKSFKPDLSPTLVYIVYDVVNPDLTFEHRLEILERVIAKAPKQVILATTTRVRSEADVLAMHKRHVKQGYEGTIIRNNNAGYELGHRTDQLLKLKDFHDGEYKIVGVREGEGKFKETPIFVCVTEEGLEFDCTPTGTLEMRRELFKDRKNLIGKYLMIQYADLSNDNKPQHLTGVGIRELGEF